MNVAIETKSNYHVAIATVGKLGPPDYKSVAIETKCSDLLQLQFLIKILQLQQSPSKVLTMANNCFNCNIVLRQTNRLQLQHVSFDCCCSSSCNYVRTGQ